MPALIRRVGKGARVWYRKREFFLPFVRLGTRMTLEERCAPLNRAETWRMLMDAASVGLVLMDDEGILDCNRAYLDLIGLRNKDEARGMTVADVSPPLQPDGLPSVEKVRNAFLAAQTTGFYELEWQFRRPTDGGEFVGAVAVCAITLVDGHAIYQIVIHDITEQRQREEFISARASRLQRIVENLPTGAAYFEGETVFLNRAAQEITGYTNGEIRTKDDWFRCLYGEQADIIRPLYEMDREAGFPLPVAIPIRHQDGRKRVIQFAAHRDPESGADIVVMTDITDDVRMSEAEEQEQRILEMISGGDAIGTVLTEIAGLVVSHLPGAACAIYTLDDCGENLCLTGSPNLDPHIVAKAARLPLDGTILPGIVNAFLTGESRIVADVTTAPEWAGGGVASEAGYAACWARPVCPGSGPPVAVIAFFFREPVEPERAESHLLMMAGHVIGLAIQRRRSDDALRRANDELEARVRERTAELRRANRELEAERVRLETVLREMPAGVVIVEIGTGRVQMMNEQVNRIWRLPTGEFKDNQDLLAITVERPNGELYSFEELPLRAFRTGEAVDDFEFAIRRYDGTRGIVLASASPLIDADGRPTSMVVTLKDITDLKNTEEALRRLHEELETQVQERTAELARANSSLRAEVRSRERAEQVSRGQTALLTRALNDLAARPDLDTFLSDIMRAIGEQYQADGLTVFLYEPDNDTVVRRLAFADGNLKAEEELIALGFAARVPAADAPAWQTFLRDPRPFVSNNVANDPRLMTRTALSQFGVQTMFLVPLLLNEQPIGWFSVLHRRPHPYPPEDIELARALAHQVALAVRLGRMAEEGRENAILEERNRMAREIHDTLAQGFTSIIIHLQLAEAAMSRRPEQALPTLLKARDIARESLAEARRSVWALRPNALDGSNLADGLRRLVDSMTNADTTDGSARPTVRPLIEVSGIPRSLPAEMESNMLRVGQEALNNAFKYANATEIRVLVHFEADCLSLTIRDNGQGFEPDEKPKGSGFGHTGMRERLTALRGQLTIESAPGAGTTVRAEVPI